MAEDIISSPQNPRVKNLVRLHESNHRRRQERYIIEGQREIERALSGKVQLEELFYAPSCFRDRDEYALLSRAEDAGATLCQLSQAAFEKCSLREGPDGLLAVAVAKDLDLDAISLGPCPLLVVVERVEKPGNLGTLIRTAGAAGADALIVTDPVTDIYNPQCIRNSQGVCFHLPISVTTNERAQGWLQRHGVQCIATTPDTTVDFWAPDYRKPTAILLGSEKDGLTDFWLKQPEILSVKIPMAGAADSLNVAVAAAVVIFEAVRQRRS
ncbi:MAG: RNA methyltransferase [Verrucomicrobiota bacterium]|nr:RNA methyltransferase [Verrucomicrobiota bacterium]